MGNKGIVALKPGPLVESCWCWETHVLGNSRQNNLLVKKTDVSSEGLCLLDEGS